MTWVKIQKITNSHFFAPTSSQSVKLLRMEPLFRCPTWTLWKREGKYMTRSATAWLPPSLWKPVTLLWLLCTAVYLPGLLELYCGTAGGSVIYSGGIQGAMDSVGVGATVVIYWRGNASPDLSHWGRLIYSCDLQSLGINNEKRGLFQGWDMVLSLIVSVRSVWPTQRTKG